MLCAGWDSIVLSSLLSSRAAVDDLFGKELFLERGQRTAHFVPVQQTDGERGSSREGPDIWRPQWPFWPCHLLLHNFQLSCCRLESRRPHPHDSFSNELLHHLEIHAHHCLMMLECGAKFHTSQMLFSTGYQSVNSTCIKCRFFNSATFVICHHRNITLNDPLNWCHRPHSKWAKKMESSW